MHRRTCGGKNETAGWNRFVIIHARLPETDREKRTREADKEGDEIIKGNRGEGERERKVNYRFHDKRFARSNRRGITGRT